MNLLMIYNEHSICLFFIIFNLRNIWDCWEFRYCVIELWVIDENWSFICILLVMLWISMLIVRVDWISLNWISWDWAVRYIRYVALAKLNYKKTINKKNAIIIIKLLKTLKIKPVIFKEIPAPYENSADVENMEEKIKEIKTSSKYIKRMGSNLIIIY